MKRIALLLVFLPVAAGISGIATAETPTSKSMNMSQMDMKSMDKMDKGKNKTSEAPHSGTGVVKSVDTATGSITLAHEPIKSLNWPAMTMAFKVKDKGLLDKTKPGDKVQFTVVQSGKDYVVTSIK